MVGKEIVFDKVGAMVGFTWGLCVNVIILPAGENVAAANDDTDGKATEGGLAVVMIEGTATVVDIIVESTTFD